MRKIVGNVCFWGGVLFLFISSFLYKISLETYIVMNPDQTIAFSTDNYCLEQTWSPHVKKITEVKLPYIASKAFSGVMELKIIRDGDDDACYVTTKEHEFLEGEQGEIVFCIDKFDVDLGARYRFQFKFLPESESGMIEIPAGEKYSGGSVDEEEIGKAIGLKFIFEKNSKLFWVMASFSPICIALFFSVLWNKRIEETLAMGFIVGILTIYGMGLLNMLKAGVYVVYFLAMICWLGAYVLCVRRKRDIREMFTPGVAVYGVAMLFFMVACRNIKMRFWDEYIHWGLAAKDMYYYDAFSKHVDSCVSLKRYPPFSTLLEYFFVYNNGVFSEGILFVAYFAFSFSLLIIVFKNVTWKKRTYLYPSLMIIGVLPIVFFNNFYTIYVDYLLMVLLAYVLVCYFSEEMTTFNLLRISLGLTAMVLTKDMGLLLAGMFSIIVLVDALWDKLCKKGIKGRWGHGILFLLVTVSSFASWQIYLKVPLKIAVGNNNEIGSDVSSNITKITDTISASHISLNGLWEVFTHQADEYKYEVIKKYLWTLLFEDTFELGYIKLSYVSINILLLIIAVVFVYQKKKVNTAYKCWKDRTLRFVLMATVICIGYALFLLTTYLFAFSSKEALSLASHERYLATCIGGVTIAFGMIGVMNAETEQTGIYKIAIYSLSAVLLTSVPLAYLLPDNYITSIRDENIVEYDEIEEIFRSFADRKETVYYVYNNSCNAGVEKNIFKTYVCPLKMQGGGALYGSEKALEKEEILLLEEGQSLNSKKIVSVEEFENILCNCDYVFLHQSGYTFAESYGELFAEPELIGDKTYFRVENNAGDITLYYMGSMS